VPQAGTIHELVRKGKYRSAGLIPGRAWEFSSFVCVISPSFRVVADPVSASRLGDGDGRLTRCIIHLTKLKDEGREPASDVVCRWVRVGTCVLVTSE
jgi:hypothetical protein